MWRTVAMVGGLAGIGLAGCGSSASKTNAAPSQCGAGSGLTRTVTTHSYTMVLDVGPDETMYTQAQIAAQHLTSGEVMLRGQMTDMSGTAGGSSASTMMEPTTMMGGGPGSSSSMPTGTPVTGMAGASGPSAVRHLEVHICSLSTGQVVQDAQPAITVVDHSSANMTDHVPIAVMQGVGMGTADLHYGNNLTMPGGHSYTVTVGLNGDTATFNFVGPS